MKPVKKLFPNELGYPDRIDLAKIGQTPDLRHPDDMKPDNSVAKPVSKETVMRLARIISATDSLPPDLE